MASDRLAQFERFNFAAERALLGKTFAHDAGLPMMALTPSSFRLRPLSSIPLGLTNRIRPLRQTLSSSSSSSSLEKL